MSAKKRMTVNLTAEQFETLQKLMELMQENNQSAFLKGIIKNAVEEAGLEWVEDENAWGGKRKTP